jgi:hypothetical protein
MMMLKEEEEELVVLLVKFLLEFYDHVTKLEH